MDAVRRFVNAVYDFLFVLPNDTIEKILVWMMAGLVLVLVAMIAIIIFEVVCDIMHEYVKEGEIVEKYHEPERTWTQFIPILVGKVTIMMPFVHYDDEDWILVVKGRTSNGNVQTDRFYVSEERWNSVNIGDWFVVAGGDETTDPHEKTRE